MADAIFMPGILHPVESSNLESAGWWKTEGGPGQLRVKFKSGALWAYDGVTQSDVQELLNAVSPGSAFQLIKNYPEVIATRLDPETHEPLVKTEEGK